MLFIDRFTVIDFSYLCSQRGLVGESWQVDLALEGRLDEQGMLVDFGTLKRTIKGLIDETFDHKLLVPTGDPGTQVIAGASGLQLTFTCADGRVIRHHSPADAVCLLEAPAVTPGRLAEAVVAFLTPHLPDNVRAVHVNLWPERSGDAFYHYSHGLKHHAGNCQRIAHGHRSRIVIVRNGHRDLSLEADWARRWRDIYLATRCDITGRHAEGGINYLEFGYKARQGCFSLSLPEKSCYLLDEDSTVENIAQHIATKLKERLPEACLAVYAYEGIDKGAAAGVTGGHAPPGLARLQPPGR
jgi:6-pyruvoyl-tetrahydropterin synthase